MTSQQEVQFLFNIRRYSLIRIVDFNLFIDSDTSADDKKVTEFQILNIKEQNNKIGNIKV